MNMRKIIAVLAAVLMLCAAIPMGALSVAAAVSADFEDGSTCGWASDCNLEVIDDNGNKVLKWDSSPFAWANMFNYCGLSANTDYVLTLNIKADRNTNLNFKVLQGDWATVVSVNTFDVTTEWQEVTVEFNYGDGAFVMFQNNAEAAGDGAIYYLDNISIEEYVAPVVPGTVINGDFETGNTDGWNIHQNVTVTADAAHDGSYGAHLQDNGTWGGIMDQTIPVTAGKSYEISFWIQVNQRGINLQIKDGDASGASLASGTWYDYNSHSTWTQKTYIVTPSTDAIFLNFCGAGDGTPDEADITNTYIDSFTVTELKEPSNDGYIINGDFEVGDLQSWDPLWWASNISLVEDGYNSAYAMKFVSGGDYQLVRQLVNVEPNTDYVIQCYAKNASNMTLMVKSAPADQNMKQVPLSGSDWTLNTLEFNSGDLTQVYVGVMGNVADATAIVDNITMAKKGSEPEQPEQPENAVIWSVDFNDGDKKFNNGEIAVGPDGSNCFKWSATGGWSATYVTIPGMDPSKDYTITMKAKASVAGNMGITIQNGDWGSYWNAPSFAVTTEWTDVVYTIPANSIPFAAGSILFKFQDTGVAMDLYVDDIVISEGLIEIPEEIVDTTIPNGDFESGEIAPWDNLWGSCPTVEIVEGGQDSNYALHIVSKKYNHVRQTNLAANSNTWYKISLWAKNTTNMTMLVKNGADNFDLLNKGIEGGEDWTYNEYYFNSGDYNTLIVSLMGGDGEGQQEGTFDNIVIERLDCEFVEEIVEPTCTEDGEIIYTCDCGEHSFTETIPGGHNLQYNPAKDAIDCANPGNIENWFCTNCFEYFANAEATEMINPWYIEITVDCVRPEGIADCATVTCETCGNEIYGYGEHDVLTCQGGTCSKCNAEIEGYGCQNFDTPACEDGVCYYCGGFVAGFGHENGAMEPCVDGECAYGCGLQYPATEDHVDSDADDYCDVCWNHLAHIDEDGDAWCDICWSEIPQAPVEIIYGDADGDGEVTLLDAALLSQYLGGYDVTLGNEAAADADADGEITLLDSALLSQYLGGYDVELGPQEG